MFRKTGWGFVLIGLLVAGSIYSILPPRDTIPLGIDLRGGFELLYRLDTSTLTPEAIPGIAEKAKEIMSRRLDKYGLKEISISVIGNERLLIQIPGLGSEEVDSMRETIERAGVLNFHIVSPEAEQTPERIKEIEREWETYRAALQAAQAGGATNAFKEPEPLRLVAEEIRDDDEEEGGGEKKAPGRKLVLENEKGKKVEGRLLRDAYPTVDTETNTPAVGFEFGAEGASQFSDLTRTFLKRQLAIVLDDAVVSAPVIQDVISTRGIIKGRFTDRQVRTLSNILRVGSLPAKPILEQEHSVGSVLGRDSIQRGLNAAILGVTLVVLFMLIYYVRAGVIAVVCLLMNILFVLAYVAIFRQTLTFPGVAGIVLGIGMAVDANILIFERVREEVKKGKSLLQSLGNGYRRAFWVIFDSNLTTVITAVVLFKLGTGAVKGFAVTVMAGLIANFFTAVYVSRLGFSFLYNRGILKRLYMLQAFETPKFSFIGHRRGFMTLSVAVIATGLAVIAYRGSNILGIDFTGGTRIMVSVTRPMRIAEFREIVQGIRDGDATPFRDAEIQTIGEEAGQAMTFTIRTRLVEGPAKADAAEGEPAAASPAPAEAPAEEDATPAEAPVPEEGKAPPPEGGGTPEAPVAPPPAEAAPPPAEAAPPPAEAAPPPAEAAPPPAEA
ncbi:MAG: protein translocase subunit SecD, partial [Planctomycetes bacterium]|nr:protein translocase subunit SecD [Planctomycetota bacterium]